MTPTPDYIYIITVKVLSNPNHNPRVKRAGRCNFSEYCSDKTGAHHCFLVLAKNRGEAQLQVEKKFIGIHITRIERALFL